MNLERALISVAIGLALSASVVAEILPTSQKGNTWFINAAAQLQQKLSLKSSDKAKNVILFVGDGMGVSTLTAARILEGQRQGSPGEENLLSFESFPFTTLVKTYNTDAQVPDSAGTMTAMMSGLKTDAGVLGVDEDVQRGDCSTVAGNEVVTALELAEIKGLSTGVVSTARITHATPAAAYAKSADRNWEDISDMPAEAVQAGCKDIADQLVSFEQLLEQRYAGVDTDGIDVVMGGWSWAAAVATSCQMMPGSTARMRDPVSKATAPMAATWSPSGRLSIHKAYTCMTRPVSTASTPQPRPGCSACSTSRTCSTRLTVATMLPVSRH